MNECSLVRVLPIILLITHCSVLAAPFKVTNQIRKNNLLSISRELCREASKPSFYLVVILFAIFS